MLSFLQGKIESKSFNPSRCVINVNGFGLLVLLSTRGLSQVEVGKEAKIFTSLNFSQESLKLFGFFTDWELELFELLGTVKGIGPRSALALIDGISPQQIVQAILEESHDILAQAQGIGKKTAERIVFELKPKLPELERIAMQSINPGDTQVEIGKFGEVANILQSLGYSQAEIEKSIKANASVSQDASIDSFLKSCLSWLSVRA